jgi:nucleoside-diphosphate-sugar epimerase
MVIAAQNEKANGQIFNLGGDEIVSLHDLAELLVKVNGTGQYYVKEFPDERKRIDIGYYFSDYSKFKGAFDWSPKTNLEEGLKQTIEYFRKHLNKDL